MPADPAQKHFPPLPPATAPLWLGIIAAPLVWLAQLQSLYTMTPQACAHGRLRLVISTIICLSFSVAFGGVCLAYRLDGDEPADLKGRIRFVASLGLLISALVALMIIAQGIAMLMLDPCAA